MDIGDRIKDKRESLNMSQDELALKVGYKSRSSINKIELDGRGLPQSKITAFANALDTTPAYLMGWDEPLSISITDLSESESELIEGYRQLNEEGREHIDLQMDFVLSKDYFKKRDSVKESKKKA